MDAISPETATLGIWTIARFAALAVLATEAIFLWTRRDAAQGPAGSRFFWALTPAVLLAGLCFWCSNYIAAARPAPKSVVAQLAR
jgi:hypothetical protein